MGRLAAAALTLTLGIALTGCGQKGPLYLPDDEPAAERYGPRETQQDNDDTADNES